MNYALNLGIVTGGGRTGKCSEQNLMREILRHRPFLIGILAGALVVASLGFFVVPFLGVFNISANGNAGPLDWWGATNMNSSLYWRTEDRAMPPEASEAKGLEHYRASCIICHGAPGISPAEWASHMQPRPPKLLEQETQEMSDGDLYYIVTNGLRMTGMPSFGQDHDEADLWNIIAFVRHLNQLSDLEKAELKQHDNPHH